MFYILQSKRSETLPTNSAISPLSEEVGLSLHTRHRCDWNIVFFCFVLFRFDGSAKLLTARRIEDQITCVGTLADLVVPLKGEGGKDSQIVNRWVRDSTRQCTWGSM